MPTGLHLVIFEAFKEFFENCPRHVSGNIKNMLLAFFTPISLIMLSKSISTKISFTSSSASRGRWVRHTKSNHGGQKETNSSCKEHNFFLTIYKAAAAKRYFLSSKNVCPIRRWSGTDLTDAAKMSTTHLQSHQQLCDSEESNFFSRFTWLIRLATCSRDEQTVHNKHVSFVHNYNCVFKNLVVG